MNVEELRRKSKDVIGPYCKACPICDGRACSNKIPGPGAKGKGKVAIENYEAWQDIYVKLDTICENRQIDTSIMLFGKTFKYPIFCGPVGAIAQHYSDYYNDDTYNATIIKGAREAGICAFTGDGLRKEIVENATKHIKENDGIGIPTIKPWDKKTCFEKLDLAKKSNAFAIAMDIDAAGLPFLQGQNPPAGRKSVEELKEIIDYCKAPFIIKGIMSVNGAKKAIEAGASGIVVSNHGGRVLDGCMPSAKILPEIVQACKGKVKIFVDGGIRSGVDVFKALALGADAVIIARPYVNAVFGDGEQGVKILTESLGQELENTMMMCGVSSLKEINKEHIYR